MYSPPMRSSLSAVLRLALVVPLGCTGLLLASACSSGGSSGCQSDVDCKGDRICNTGLCTSPSGSGGGGASSTSTTASSSSGGAGGASTTSTTTSSTSTGPCTTDDDSDGAISWVCDPNDPAKDCADEDVRASPGGSFQATPITGAKKPGTLPFDFDCNGVEEMETAVLSCTGLLSTACGTATGFQAAVQCGQSAPLGHCVASGLACAWAAMTPSQNQIQRCK